MALPENIRLHLQWQSGNPDIAGKVLHFWEKLDVLPQGVNPNERVKELVYCALNGNEEIVGVTSAVHSTCPFINLPMMFIRFLVHPDYRGQRIGHELMLATILFFEAQSKDGEYWGAKGIATLGVNKSLVNHYQDTIIKEWGTVFIGDLESGERVRIRYFPGSTL